MEDVMLMKKVTKAAKWSTITELVAKSIAPITTIILARL
jgi:O-antigen/teichoic acid export membrane protein